MSEPILLTDNNFKTEVLESSLPVLVDFWAEWCGPCKMLAPVIEEIAADYDGLIKVGKLNVDQNPNATSSYRIRSIPTLIIFKDGKPSVKDVGGVPKSYIVNLIEEVLEREKTT